MLRFSARIKRLCDFTGKCVTVGDIGCDHGLTAIRMLQRGLCERAIASDIRKGPLEKARTNIAEAGLSGRAEVRLGPGLTTVRPGECDAFIIAGMGGLLIADILESSPDTARTADFLILQPNSCQGDLRRALWSRGWEIEAEDVMEERGQIYLFMRVKYTGAVRNFSYAESELGLILPGTEAGRIYVSERRAKAEIRLRGLLAAEEPSEEEIQKAREIICVSENILK